MQLLENLRVVYNLSSAVEKILRESVKVQHLPKKTLLLSMGQICSSVYYLEKGLARGFYEANGGTITAWFVKEGDFVYTPRSFLSQQPTQEAVELLEDCTVATIPLAILNHLYAHHPETNEIGRLITEKYLVMYDDRVRAMRNINPSQRVENFMRDFPELFERAPNNHIASYLGTSPETFSRYLGSKHK